MARVLLAMSGGVDSSVAAHLLVDAGHDVIGVFMRHGQRSPVACDSSTSETGLPSLPIVADRPDHKQGCCTAADADDGRRVADRLGIPFYALDLNEDFGRIIDYFVDEYTAGRTPNPCVVCNTWLKFGRLFDYADGGGAEYVATGHYARLSRDAAGRTILRRGVDTSKDQSYVLFGVERARLDRTLLPVGEFTKPRIRALATDLGLAVAEKKDSQDLCFVTSGKHDAFIRSRRAGDMSGEIVTTEGEVVGRHPGIEGFTVGQRKGLGVALGTPRFVVRVEAETRRVVIGEKEALARQELFAERVNWLVDEPSGDFRCHAQIRYNSTAAAAQVEPLGGGRIRVVFDAPQFGVAPGQAVVCYDGQQVLGGGWIE